MVDLETGWLMRETGTCLETDTGGHHYLYGLAMITKRSVSAILSRFSAVLIWEQVVCISSIAELEELTGATGLTDIHREHIDHLTIPSKMGKGELKRVEEVFDCWFESGR